MIGALVSNLILARAQVKTQNSRISWTNTGKAASDKFHIRQGFQERWVLDPY
jgi:hypothetical protein